MNAEETFGVAVTIPIAAIADGTANLAEEAIVGSFQRWLAIKSCDLDGHITMDGSAVPTDMASRCRRCGAIYGEVVA